MDNKGFEVKLNGKLLYRAGLKENHGVVTCILDAHSRKENKQQVLRLNISGLNSDNSQHVKWLRGKELQENDEVSIKIIRGEFDEPTEKSEERSNKWFLEQKIKTYNKLKEELKDYL